jgi:hypothetical protein
MLGWGPQVKLFLENIKNLGLFGQNKVKISKKSKYQKRALEKFSGPQVGRP